MRRRIFIAVNLPAEVKKKLLDYQVKWPELPARWAKPDNIHITLIFLGYITEEELPAVCQATKQIAAQNKPFLIKLDKVCYGPPKKTPPRMIWVNGEPSPELTKIKKDLEKSLSEDVHFHQEQRAFSPHITLARIKGWDWKKIEPEERPEVEETLDLSFEVNSIEVMESELKRKGPSYLVLESAPLEDEDIEDIENI